MIKYILCFYALLIFAVTACPSSKRNDNAIYPMRSDRNQFGMYNQEPLSSLKVSKSQKQIIMSLILQKNRQNRLRILPHCSFFGRIWDFIICFRDLLTFSKCKIKWKIVSNFYGFFRMSEAWKFLGVYLLKCKIFSRIKILINFQYFDIYINTSR